MKKISALALAFCMVIGMAACGQKAAAPKETQAPATEAAAAETEAAEGETEAAAPSGDQTVLKVWGICTESDAILLICRPSLTMKQLILM